MLVPFPLSVVKGGRRKIGPSPKQRQDMGWSLRLSSYASLRCEILSAQANQGGGFDPVLGQDLLILLQGAWEQ
jgi:hypothetical protein